MKRRVIFTVICWLLPILFIMTEAKAETFETSLENGWNLISTPLQPQNTSINQVLLSIDGQYRDVWKYTSSGVNDQWKHYHPNYISFSDLNTIEFNNGYWIYSNQTAILTTSGIPVSANQTISLKEGWNLIGWPFLYSQPISEALSSLIIGIDYDQVARFNPSTQTQENFFGQLGFDQFDTFEPGKAYYIYALRDCSVTLIFDTTPPAKPTVNSFITPTNDEIQTLSGTKDANSSIWINGVEKVPIDDLTTWSVSILLVEGDNPINITSKDAAGNESEAVSIVILLDTQGPNILSIEANPTRTDSTTTISGTVKAAADLKEIRLTGPIENSPIIILNTEIPGGNFTQEVTLTETGNIIATAYDNLDNAGTQMLTPVILDKIVTTTIDYVYDDLNRLGNVTHNDGASVVYTYDEIGNITNKTAEESAP